MIDHDTFLEETWSALLSRDKGEILRAFNALDEASRKVVMEHLKKMATEEGWHPEQIMSAKSALSTIPNEDPH